MPFIKFVTDHETHWAQISQVVDVVLPNHDAEDGCVQLTVGDGIPVSRDEAERMIQLLDQMDRRS